VRPPNDHRRQATNSSGFTLVEILVAVAIVGALVAILLPAVQQARQTARRVACLSNLHEWMIAFQHYADIHDGYLPRRGQGVKPTQQLNQPDDWFNALPPLMENTPYTVLVAQNAKPKAQDNSVWICPESKELDAQTLAAYRITNDTDPTTFFSYGMNMWLSTTLSPLPDHLEHVGPTSTMVVMADGLGPWCSVVPSTQPYSPLARHGGLVNIGFLDGHVSSLPGDLVGCGVGDPQLPDVRWIVPGSVWTGPPL
jgi:prepilin-type processing-associated H-X9-DG protein/prepilin-type N-terminal cleavage/methylation domain-containing protein